MMTRHLDGRAAGGSQRAAATLVAVALAAFSGACASAGGAVPRPFPAPAGAPRAAAKPVEGGTAAAGTAEPEAGAAAVVTPVEPSVVGVASSVLETALALRGVPYRNGGSDLAGFDCSGFTQYVFAQHALALPREVKDQFEVGRKVSRDDLRPGDLLFFATTSRHVSHVGIALDSDTFVHAPSTNGVVRIEHLSAEYWRTRFLGVRRVLSPAN